MGSVKRLILENRLGQKVRSIQVQAEEVTLIYRLDTRRVELCADLEALKAEGIAFDVIQKLQLSSLVKKELDIEGLGKLRLAAADEKLSSPQYELQKEEDKEKMMMALKKSGIGHAAAVVLLIGLSFLMTYLKSQEVPEPELVTITLPKKEKSEPLKTVKVADKKIQPITKTRAKVADRTTKTKVNRQQVVKKNFPVPPQKFRQPIARPERNLERVGALAALGGIKTGSRNAQGLDAQSLKNIRAAGVGQGGGGIGDIGSGGGARGMLPGQGLIAGSAGRGGSAESAGGYGTKGAGGGKAGYGKISLVGGTSGVTLPLEEEALVEGGLDRDQIAAVINRNKGQIIYCYEQGLQNSPQLRGRVSVQFVIGASGKITTAQVAQSSLGSKLVETCMLSKMRGWQFPKPVGNVNVDVLYPFELRRISSR